ncbi:DciA family protein [Undibacterium griseum]|uniref:DUF721 domain-containing protein n=1 Tax=Undibacterium griseum TaxID=2762295 RepID=A0ABR6YNK9_9BURK|nr:DciA family protein [Undibacterium griseum]MBC3885491.1 DUF721 domain-containing protein [Undibacterium griseum]
MPTSSSPPFRIHIRRGRPVQGASGAADFLRMNEKFSPLLPAIQRNVSLQKDCAAILPPIFDTCEVMQLAENRLTLSAPNAALATKLKQYCPKLQAYLLERGWQINAIRIKVQVKRTVPKAPPVKQLKLSATALQAFSHLEKTMDDNTQNAALKMALTRLLERHRQK